MQLNALFCRAEFFCIQRLKQQQQQKTAKIFNCIITVMQVMQRKKTEKTVEKLRAETSGKLSHP